MNDKNLVHSGSSPVREALEILRIQEIVSNPNDLEERLEAFAALLDEWSEPLSLLSTADRGCLPEHIADSLSLVPYINEFEALVDIGSGGGFPAIPIAATLPDKPVVLIERSSRKSGFLRKAVAHLHLSHARVLHASFPVACPPLTRVAVTARAMEAPDEFYPSLRRALLPGSLILYQGAPDPGSYFPKEWISAPISDVWTAKGLRRGRLVLVTRPD